MPRTVDQSTSVAFALAHTFAAAGAIEFVCGSTADSLSGWIDLRINTVKVAHLTEVTLG